MAHELTNNELIMLDALAYYKDFSDSYTPITDGSRTIHRTVAEFISYALENPGKCKTCFDGCMGKSDEDLGMTDILDMVKNNTRITRLEFVYPDTPDDENTSSVCLVDPITKNVYVIFGGNYADSADAEFSTWVENFVGAAASDTGEQKNALKFYKDSIAAARAYFKDKDGDLNITVSGHSAAGNMAQYVTIAYAADDDYKEENDIDRCVSVDGQGFSVDFYNANLAK